MKKLILLVLIASCVHAFAQTPMVAYRKEGVFHYFDTDGKPMWTPYMDVASFPSGWQNGLLKAAGMEFNKDPKATVAISRRDFLYNNKGKIVVNPQSKIRYRIRTGFDDMGFAELRQLEDEKIMLMNKQGKIIFTGKSGSDTYLGKGLVAQLKNTKEEEKEGDLDYKIVNVLTKKLISTIKCRYFSGNFFTSAVLAKREDGRCVLLTYAGKPAFDFDENVEEANLDGEFIMPKNYIFLKHTQNETYNLYHASGKLLLADKRKIFLLSNYYCKAGNDENNYEIFQLQNDKATLAEKIPYNAYITSSNGGLIACFNGGIDSNVVYNKALKRIAAFVETDEITFVDEYIWVTTKEDPETRHVYDRTGKKINTIKAELLGQRAYGYVEFMLNDKYGLAKANGTVVVAPVAPSTATVDGIHNGYWLYTEKKSEDDFEFIFYNFKGKKVLSTTANKDGWDYIIPSEDVEYFFKVT